MSEEKKEAWYSSILTTFALCFCASGEGEKLKKNPTAESPDGPEATMVAAAKHFSSAHKVRLTQFSSFVCQIASQASLCFSFLHIGFISDVKDITNFNTYPLQTN